MFTKYDPESDISQKFISEDIWVEKIEIKEFPGEIIAVVYVGEADFSLASQVAEHVQLDYECLIVVKRSQAVKDGAKAVGSLGDPRVTKLIELLTEHSRTSEAQPSLSYVKNVADHIRLVQVERHHIVFGRRGAGKTALLLEAKRILEGKNNVTLWINVQTIRDLDIHNCLLTICSKICDLPSLQSQLRRSGAGSISKAEELKARISSLFQKGNSSSQDIGLVVHAANDLLKLLTAELQSSIYIFLDDFHYYALSQQALLLDKIHGVTRDSRTWIKVATIRHQSKWFQEESSIGLQLGHDATDLNLDITLEEPQKARSFLDGVLANYFEKANISSMRSVVSSQGLDRVVLASGGVPRDFLLLFSGALRVARGRANSKSVGIQDVNEAAGEAQSSKISELEDDTSSSVGGSAGQKDMLDRLRGWLLEEKQATFFKVDFTEKKTHKKEYQILQSLVDLRFLHMINSSLSDKHRAGTRFEVYMLDLSEYSGSRLRRNLKVLDFSKGNFVLKSTGRSRLTAKIGDTPKRLQDILRKGETFLFEDILSGDK